MYKDDQSDSFTLWLREAIDFPVGTSQRDLFKRLGGCAQSNEFLSRLVVAVPSVLAITDGGLWTLLSTMRAQSA